MYTILLSLHSIVRWFVLISLIVSIYRAYSGWLVGKLFSPFDNALRHWTATIAQIQMILGIALYFISPIVAYFLYNFKEAVHERKLRFFGMEHSLMMLTGIIIITIGSAKRKQTDKE